MDPRKVADSSQKYRNISNKMEDIEDDQESNLPRFDSNARRISNEEEENA